MTAIISLADFYDKLDRADWYYVFSDDGSVYRAGEHELATLEAMAEQSPEHRALFDGFRKHFFTGRAWNNEQVPKPDRPA